MPFYIYAWIAVIFFGFSGVTSKLASKHQITNPWLLTFIWGLVGALVTIPLAIFQGVGFPHSWFNLIILGMLGVANGLLYVFALCALDISVLAPLFTLKTVVAVFLGIVYLGETLDINQWFYIFLIIMAGIFVSLDEKFNFRSFFSKKIILALTAIISSGIMAAAFKYYQQTEGFWEVSMWSSVIAQIFLLFTAPLFWQDLKKLKPKKYSGIFITATLSTVAMLFSIKASAENVSITTAIITIPLAMVFAFIFSRVAPELLEKHPLKVYLVRFAATGVMVWAAIALSR